MDEHIYIITYDIGDPKRWRRVFKLMKGYGEWLQLSVFQCRLSRRRLAELIAMLDGVILNEHDHILILDVGMADKVELRITSLGKGFQPVVREAVVV